MSINAIWDKQFGPDIEASVISSITEDAINQYLSAHRKLDSKLYSVTRSMGSINGARFSLEMIVGGDADAHSDGSALPLIIEFEPTGLPPKGPSPRSGFEGLHEYEPDFGAHGHGSIPNSIPNIRITVPKVSFYMEWAREGGKSWKHHLDDVDFVLDAKIDLVDSDNRISVKLVPVWLTVDRTVQSRIDTSFSATRAGDLAPDPISDQDKISDLFTTVMQLAASFIGPELTANIEVPVVQVGDFPVVPTGLALSDKHLSIATHIDTSPLVERVIKEQNFLELGMMNALDADVQASGGIEQIIFTEVQQKAFAEAGGIENLSEQKIESLLLSDGLRSQDEILALLRNVTTFRDQEIAKFDAKLPSGDKPTGTEEGYPYGFVAAVSEDLLDAVVRDVGGVSKSGRTGRVSLLLIRGWLGYEMRIGTPDISVGSAGIGGSIPFNVFAGLYYQLRKLFKWGRVRQLGIGLKGVPEVQIQTVVSNGLSFRAKIDLSAVSLYTGLGGLLDQLVGALFGVFRGLLQLAANAVLGALSFIVVPATLPVPGQSTMIALSRFNTQQYRRHGGTDVKDNFLSVSCDVKGVK